jgi:hypothetical protein
MQLQRQNLQAETRSLSIGTQKFSLKSFASNFFHMVFTFSNKPACGVNLSCSRLTV